MRYSIIIPTYNHLKDLLIPCCESIRKYTDLLDAEVIVVANGCTDGTAKYVLESTPFTLLNFDEPIGFTRAVNEGIKASNGEYVIILNNDIELLPQPMNQWLEMLQQPFQVADNRVGITGPMKCKDETLHRNFIIFFCAMIPRAVLDDVGLLDEAFSPGFCEDNDWCARAEDKGYKIVQVPSTEFEMAVTNPNFMIGKFPIYHKGTQTFGSMGGTHGEGFKKNLEYLKKKHSRQSPIANAMKVDGYLPEGELNWLAEQAVKYERILEIGSWHGRSTRCLGDNTKGVVYAVDTWLGSENEMDSHGSANLDYGNHAFMEFYRNNHDLIEQGKIIPIRMNSLCACKTFQAVGMKFDMIFIDGDHRYESVKRDIELCLPLIDKGLLCGHDYGAWEGVKKAVEEKIQKDGTVYTMWYKHMGRPEKPKVFDCTLFYNELELLELRLNELDPVVDEFIIIESNLTTTGQPKPLYFSENQQRFAKFLPKIRCVVMYDLPDGDTWARERFARDKFNMLVNGHDGDIVIISDIDEIPSAEAVRSYKPEMGLRSFDMGLYYYWLNCYNDRWDWAKILPYSLFKSMTACQVRYTPAPKLEVPGGWHFSFQGGVDRIVQKIRAWAHSEYNRPDIVDREHIERCIHTPCDVLRRPDVPMKFVELDDTFPKFVLDNKDAIFKDWIKDMVKKKKQLPPVTVEVPSSGITAYISTKDRFHTTLPLAIRSVTQQSMKIEKFVLFMDGEHRDIRPDPMYSGLLHLLDRRGIQWEVQFTPCYGQVKNHQRMLETAKTRYLWRLDDDNDAEPDALLTLYRLIRAEDKVGAVGGCVVNLSRTMKNPVHASSRIEDFFLYWNEQWFLYDDKTPRPVDHLYSTFLYDREAAPHGYDSNLSIVGHGEETLFTHQMLRDGWSLLFAPAAVTRHYQAAQGGIRSYAGNDFWQRDEEYLHNKLAEWGVHSHNHFSVVNEHALGDHCALKLALNRNADKLNGHKLLAFSVYRGILTGTRKEGSIEEAALLFGNLERFNIYKFMADHNWQQPMWKAYQKMYFGA